MNILPKTAQEFASKEYWDRFFRQRKESFEWYGDYDDIKPILCAYIKPSDNLLIIGCGNSTLSVELFDDGYCSNTSIDISSIVIDEMISKYKMAGNRERLQFKCMDMLKMSFPDECFNVVLDKGTLDAVSSDNIDIDQMFTEISRVLKYFGRYICVTLLQEHVLVKLLSWFLQANNWICRIHRCAIKKNQQTGVDVVNFPVFIVVCTKLKTALPETFVELQMNQEKGSFQKYGHIDEVSRLIKSSQSIEFLKHSIRNNKLLDENDFHIELFDGKNLANSRYMLYFVRKKSSLIPQQSTNIRCSVFIVPQGREHEWLFSTAKGREQLLKQCSAERLIVVMLNRKHQYESMEHIKNELSTQIVDFFPINSHQKIPFLSIGEDIGQRKLLWEGFSHLNGQLFVEDVTIDSVQYRRLVFSENRNIIQSEARLVESQTDPKAKTKKTIVTMIDHRFLSCGHHEFIAASLALVNRPFKDSYNLLMIGLGGGCLVNFLLNNLQTKVPLNITIVEIDPVMEQIAREHFDFGRKTPTNITVKIIIEDGLKYLSSNVEPEPETFDFIIFDVDNKNASLGISCPPEPFVDVECLNNVATLLDQDGLFMLNLVARDEDIRRDVYDRLKKLFHHSFKFKVDDDLNEVIISTNCQPLQWLQLKDPNGRHAHIAKSCFYIDKILESTYRKLCKKIHHL